MSLAPLAVLLAATLAGGCAPHAHPRADRSLIDDFPDFELVRIAGGKSVASVSEITSATTSRRGGGDLLTRRDEFDCAIGSPAHPVFVDSLFMRVLRDIVATQVRGAGARVTDAVRGDSVFRLSYQRDAKSRGVILVTAGRRGERHYSVRFAHSLAVSE